MSEQTRKLTERWFQEVWNEGREATLNELLHPGAKAFGFPQPDSVLDHGQFKGEWSSFQSTFSEIHYTIDDMLAEGNRVALLWSFSAKHTGEGLGFAPTGMPVQLKGSSFALWQEGQITHGWNYVNLNPMLDRLRLAAQGK